MPGDSMSETVVVLRSMAPVIYGFTGLVVLILLFQTFGMDIIKHINAFGLKLAYRGRMSRTGE
jgi:hypothetical protein